MEWNGRNIYLNTPACLLISTFEQRIEIKNMAILSAGFARYRNFSSELPSTLNYLYMYVSINKANGNSLCSTFHSQLIELLMLCNGFKRNYHNNIDIRMRAWSNQNISMHSYCIVSQAHKDNDKMQLYNMLKFIQL